MPKQGTKSHSAYPDHVEQVRQSHEPKGDLVFATGPNWSGENATDSIFMAAESHAWVDAVMFR